MLGLEFRVCTECDRVFAVPDEEMACRRCGDGGLEPLARDPDDHRYFSRGLTDE